MRKVPQENNSKSRNALPAGYELLWYQIKSVLGQGAFGITYLAQDINLDRLVAIKEFLPGQYAMRDGEETVRPVSEALQEKFALGLQRFIEEARILDQFEHSNIVRIMNIFEANNTAYMVMSYEQGVSLKEILVRQKFLDESDLLNILFPILDGLQQVHEGGYIHRDIKPANIFIRTDGSPVLLDFGSARQSLDKETHTLTSLVSPGYAPIEQYVSKSDKQGPWSDIYGMAATLYRAVTGVPPSDAITRGESLTGDEKDNLVSCGELADKRYSEEFIAAIDNGLAFLTRDRPQSITEWKEAFLQSSTIRESSAGAKKVLSGYASGDVVALVNESLTQTVTRLHNDPALSDAWDNEDASSVESMEFAHKQGFKRGLKYALVLLTLLVGGLFIGNFQKIQQVVRPGYIPQDVISDEPVEINDQGKLVVGQVPEKVVEDVVEDVVKVEAESIVEENMTEEKLVIKPENKVDKIEILPESSPRLLDEQTAAELEAEGKIIIIDEVEKGGVDKDFVNTNSEIIEQSDREVIETNDKTLPNDDLKEEIIDQKIVSENEAPLEGSEENLTIDDEQVENNIEPAPGENVIPETEQELKVNSTVEVEEIDQEVIDKPRPVVIEEVYVPPVRKKEPEIADQVKKIVDFLVEHGEEGSGKGEEVKEQLGGAE